jgi:hypothetical protein
VPTPGPVNARPFAIFSETTCFEHKRDKPDAYITVIAAAFSFHAKLGCHFGAYTPTLTE